MEKVASVPAISWWVKYTRERGGVVCGGEVEDSQGMVELHALAITVGCPCLVSSLGGDCID